MRWDCTGEGEQDRIGRRFQVAARVLDFILGVMESHWRVFSRGATSSDLHF